MGRENTDIGISLAKPFEQLGREGIFARERYWCCQSCGYAAATEELEADKNLRGVVFYHEQDDEHRREGEDFYLAFRSAKLDGRSDIAIGRRVCQVLAEHGIETEWNQKSTTRIKVVQR